MNPLIREISAVDKKYQNTRSLIHSVVLTSTLLLTNILVSTSVENLLYISQSPTCHHIITIWCTPVYYGYGGAGSEHNGKVKNFLEPTNRFMLPLTILPLISRSSFSSFTFHHRFSHNFVSQPTFSTSSTPSVSQASRFRTSSRLVIGLPLKLCQFYNLRLSNLRSCTFDHNFSNYIS